MAKNGRGFPPYPTVVGDEVLLSLLAPTTTLLSLVTAYCWLSASFAASRVRS